MERVADVVFYKLFYWYVESNHQSVESAEVDWATLHGDGYDNLVLLIPKKERMYRKIITGIHLAIQLLVAAVVSNTLGVAFLQYAIMQALTVFFLGQLLSIVTTFDKV